MTMSIDCNDVPGVGMHDLYMPMRHLISEGRGLALLNGLSEADIRTLECQIWADFSDQPELRVAIALRFRALLDVFAARRLRAEFLNQGFKVIARAVAEASTQRLNTRFGFNVQKFISALAPVSRPVAQSAAVFETMQIAA
ncbi:MAG: hypothetical protein HOP09_10260 [Hyphomicrobium sp.]|nr:hypothetical protein [Hyphomicrobium sp.]